ncbi:MAG TPA: CAP domain-containing protein [Pyrinomonadaceae bacterium]|nr:CAP domain-containing protein [Pyrinomonadaceae bacterium]
MRFSQFNRLYASTLLRQPLSGLINVAVLSVAFISLGGTALAQNIQPRPVARLLSDPMSDARYSRPRRVTLENRSVRSAASAALPSALDIPTEIERRAFDQTNRARVEKGLSPLVWDRELCRMARAHSEQMALLGFFAHVTPQGSRLRERAHDNGILHFRVIAENIAYNKGYDDPGGFAVERWMISSGHRANILYVGFQAAAIGSYVSADGSTYLTQVFIAR